MQHTRGRRHAYSPLVLRADGLHGAITPCWHHLSCWNLFQQPADQIQESPHVTVQCTLTSMTSQCHSAVHADQREQSMRRCHANLLETMSGSSLLIAELSWLIVLRPVPLRLTCRSGGGRWAGWR